MAENWKAVPGHEGVYEVSDHGRVKSLNRTILVTRKGRKIRRRFPGQMISIHTDKRGYQRLCLQKAGEVRPVQVSWIVMEAFVGPRPPGQVVRHLDDNKSNNRLSNLAYGTVADNAEDARRNGTLNIGEKHARSKINSVMARIIYRIGLRMTAKEIAGVFGIHHGTVYNIRRGACWAHATAAQRAAAAYAVLREVNDEA